MRVACAAAALLAASSIATAQESDPLGTRPGWELGVQGSYYDYTEPYFPNPKVKPEISGNRLGVVGSGTYVDSRAAFAKIDLRASYGSLDYSGSGTFTGVPDLMIETRGLIGADVIGASASLSPYLGLAYRYLYNDIRGTSSTGAVGYRRYSNYLYTPVGLTARFRFADGWILAPTLEADIFLKGKQITTLSDTGIPGAQDVTNRQDSGRGHRASLMFEKDHWSFGAWNHYWHIDNSDCVPPVVVNGVCTTAQEPENYTREYGLELRYRF